MKKLLLYASLLLLLLASIFMYNYTHHVSFPGPITSIASTPWQPAALRVDALHINAPVIDVGETADGRMDTPVSQAIHSPYWSSVFWYALGPAPGQAGNAVIAGHVDRVGGDPAIFWSLSALQAGMTIAVQTNAGKTLQFMVERVVHYPANAPSQDILNSVFGPTSAHHLNLITCSGVWTGNGYDERLVVFTTQTL